MPARITYRLLTFTICMLWSMADIWAQCSQCKAAAATKNADGELVVGAGINTGVLYLLALPIVLPLLIGGIWWWRGRQLRKAPSGPQHSPASS